MGWYGGSHAFFGGMWWGPVVGILIMLAVLAAVVWVIVAVARAASGRHNAHPPGRGSDPALDALRERYARGEIDGDTYERMRRDLER